MTSQSTEKTLVPVAILAGGKSSRFGADKAQAILAGKPLMQHVYDQMAAQTIGLWRVADLERLETALEEGVRAAHAWIDLCGALPVSFELERSVDPFFNINTRDDLEIAEAFLRAS